MRMILAILSLMTISSTVFSSESTMYICQADCTIVGWRGNDVTSQIGYQNNPIDAFNEMKSKCAAEAIKLNKESGILTVDVLAESGEKKPMMSATITLKATIRNACFLQDDLGTRK